MNDYASFLTSKKLVAPATGRPCAPEDVNLILFPWQRQVVAWAVRKGRGALLADTGLGKSFMQIEWARLTGERTLILAPLAVASQTVREGEKLGVPITYARSQEQAAPTGLTISNYEMFLNGHFDANAFGAIVLDESSCLKDETSVRRVMLTAAFQRTPYRLAATATAAPNDIAEIANHAEFLGLITRAELLACFFLHDDNGWRMKKHARQPFYRWLASWAMSLKLPSDIGFDDTGYNLPPLQVHPVFVDTDYVPPGRLFADRLNGVSETAAVRRDTIGERVQRALALIEAEPEEPWIVWTGLNEESRLMAKGLGDAVEVVGSDPVEKKIKKLTDFTEGRARVLVSKTGICGHGMNWQHCARMVFVGMGYSFEQYYQAVRRCYRFGQTRPVQVFIVLSEPERPIFEAVMEKEREAQTLAAELVAHVKEFERQEILAINPKQSYRPGQQMELPRWLTSAARPTSGPACGLPNERIQVSAADHP